MDGYPHQQMSALIIKTNKLNMNQKMQKQILLDRMYNDLIQEYDTIGMSDQELSDTHDEIITIINTKL